MTEPKKRKLTPIPDACPPGYDEQMKVWHDKPLTVPTSSRAELGALEPGRITYEPGGKYPTPEENVVALISLAKFGNSSPLKALSWEEYGALDGVRLSLLRNMGRSPAHYQHAVRVGGIADTAALKRGRRVHSCLFENSIYRSSVAVWDGGRRQGKEWEKFKLQFAGFDILTVDEKEQVLAIAEAVSTDRDAQAYLTSGVAERAVEWEARSPLMAPLEYSFRAKGRLDYVNAGAIADLKVMRNVSPRKFASAVVEYGYDVAAAWYSDGLEAATGVRLPFVLVAVEEAPPHVVQVYTVPQAVIDRGRSIYQGWLEQLARCWLAFGHETEGKKWPGYSDHPLELELPRWAVPADDENLAELGLTFGEGADDASV